MEWLLSSIVIIGVAAFYVGRRWRKRVQPNRFLAFLLQRGLSIDHVADADPDLIWFDDPDDEAMYDELRRCTSFVFIVWPSPEQCRAAHHWLVAMALRRDTLVPPHLAAKRGDHFLDRFVEWGEVIGFYADQDSFAVEFKLTWS